MNCDTCDRQMNYAFYIDDEHWRKVVGEEKFEANVGRICAHCVLEKLSGVNWRITWKPPCATATVANADLPRAGQCPSDAALHNQAGNLIDSVFKPRALIVDALRAAHSATSHPVCSAVPEQGEREPSMLAFTLEGTTAVLRDVLKSKVEGSNRVGGVWHEYAQRIVDGYNALAATSLPAVGEVEDKNHGK